MARCKKRYLKLHAFAAALSILLAFAAPGQGQLLTHNGSGSGQVRSMAGVLGGHFGESEEYTYLCSEKMLLIAVLEGDLLQYRGRGTHDTEHDDASDGGCGHGGPPGFLIEVLREGEVEPHCFAERPRYPGWLRDPRLACMLTGDAENPTMYRIRVSLSRAAHDHVAEPEEAGMPEFRPYVLTLRGFLME